MPVPLWRVATSLALFPLLAVVIAVIMWLAWALLLLRTQPPRLTQHDLIFRADGEECIQAAIPDLSKLAVAYSVRLSVTLEWPDRPDLALAAHRPFVLDCLVGKNQPVVSFAFVPQFSSTPIRHARLLFLAPLYITRALREQQSVSFTLPAFTSGTMRLCPQLPLSRARLMAHSTPRNFVLRILHYWPLQALLLVGAAGSVAIGIALSAVVCITFLILGMRSAAITDDEDTEVEESESEDFDLASLFDVVSEDENDGNDGPALRRRRLVP